MSLTRLVGACPLPDVGGGKRPIRPVLLNLHSSPREKPPESTMRTTLPAQTPPFSTFRDLPCIMQIVPRCGNQWSLKGCVDRPTALDWSSVCRECNTRPPNQLPYSPWASP